MTERQLSKYLDRISRLQDELKFVEEKAIPASVAISSLISFCQNTREPFDEPECPIPDLPKKGLLSKVKHTLRKRRHRKSIPNLDDSSPVDCCFSPLLPRLCVWKILEYLIQDDGASAMSFAMTCKWYMKCWMMNERFDEIRSVARHQYRIFIGHQNWEGELEFDYYNSGDIDIELEKTREARQGRISMLLLAMADSDEMIRQLNGGKPAKENGMVREFEFDVGSHRVCMYIVRDDCERRKYMHMFQRVDVVVFLSPMDNYDHRSYECGCCEHPVQRSLKLFDMYANSKWFSQADVIVLLSRKEEFREKLKSVDLEVCFADYRGGKDFQIACDFFQYKYRALNRRLSPHPLYIRCISLKEQSPSISMIFHEILNERKKNKAK